MNKRIGCLHHVAFDMNRNLCRSVAARTKCRRRFLNTALDQPSDAHAAKSAPALIQHNWAHYNFVALAAFEQRLQLVLFMLLQYEN